MGSIFRKGLVVGLILMLGITAFVGFLEFNFIMDASGESWTETSDDDFGTGTMDNIEVIGTDVGASMQLKLKNNLSVWHQRNLKPPELFEHAMAYDSYNNKVVLFGGLDSTYNDETWVYDVATDTWTQKNPTLKPSGRVRTGMAYDSANKKVVLFGGYDSTIYGDTWVYDVALDTWIQMNPSTKPSARQIHAMAYDSANNKVVMFGGYDGSSSLNDTWVYDLASDTWTQKNPSIKPPARTKFTMVYDSYNKKTVLFGGGISSGRTDDTWVYDLVSDTWTQKNPSTKPSARMEHIMAYDSLNKKVVLFGGYDGSYDDETWVYDVASNTWTQKYPSNKPSGRISPAMVYDSANNKAVLFGGYELSDPDDETWVYDVASDKWTQKGLTTRPFARNGHAMAYDSSNNKVVLFGGLDGSGLDGETWLYDVTSDTWMKQSPSINPSARKYHAMTYDSENNKVVLFGGNNGTRCDDTWVYEVVSDTWTQKNPSVKPPAREFHEMVYDSLNEKVVLFGGHNGSNLNDTWVYDVASDTWTQKNPTIKPSARGQFALAFDSTNNKVVLFGGYEGYARDDTWVYDVASDTWTQKNPSTKPSARYGHSMVYYSENKYIVLFGGHRIITRNDETWVYDLEADNWIQKRPILKPSPRRWFAMVYDSVNKKVVLYGGNAPSLNDETWIFNLNNYYNDGTYLSKTYSANVFKWHRITWVTDTAPDGFVRFQVALNNDGKTWNYVGPDGSSLTYYDDVTGGLLYSGYNGMFLRYKAYFTTPYAGNTPQLLEVSISYLTQGPSVKVTSPNGGEDWMKEDYYPITWEAEGVFNNSPINLYYSVNNGANWTIIQQGIQNLGFYNWTVPNIETSNALIGIEVIDIYGNNVIDTSDMSFAIDPPPPGYVPSGGNEKENTTKNQPEKTGGSEDSIPSSSGGKGGSDLELGLIAGAMILVVISIIIMLFTIFLIFRSKRPQTLKVPGRVKNRGNRDLRLFKREDKNNKFKGGVK
jgi:hypothetical protein